MAIADLREKINQNRNWSIGVISVLVVLAAILGWRWFWPVRTAGRPSSYYFYDLANGGLSTAPSNKLPPLIGATGKPTLVRAVMLTCTGCGDRKLAYLLKYTAAAKAARRLLNHPPGPSATPMQATEFAAQLSARKLQMTEGTLVRLPAHGSPWMPALSPAGATLIRNANECPGESFAKPCNP